MLLNLVITSELNKWKFKLKPTMDNRFGDFRLPAFEGFVGAEIRRLEFSEDREDWNYVTCGYGPKFMKLGPLPDSEDLDAFEKQLLSEEYINDMVYYRLSDKKNSKLYQFQKYEYSNRMGIENDPGHQGYHGLKGEISDEFIFTGKQDFKQTTTEYLPEEEGDTYYFWSTVYAEKDEEVDINVSDFKPIKVWVNGTLCNDAREVSLNQGVNKILLKYKGSGRGYFIVEAKNSPKDWKQSYPLSMSWYNKPGVYAYDVLPKNVLTDKENITSTGYYRFNSAPALKELSITAYGGIKVLVDGKRIDAVNFNDVTYTNTMKYGTIPTTYKVCIANKNPRCSKVEIEITQEKGYYRGAALSEPIIMECEEGIIELGDWSEYQGLYCYSGGAYYKKNIMLTKEHVKKRVVLDLGEVVSSVELSVNGKSAGIKVAPPWIFDITDIVTEGESVLEALVYNTLRNHYTTIPTKYRGKIKSGLIGPVKIRFEKLKMRN